MNEIEERVKKLWVDFMEFTKKHESSIRFWGVPLFEPWSSGERKIVIIMAYLNEFLWDDIVDLVNKNNLRIRHWSIFAKNGELEILLWVRPKEA
jgi:hypothetical protein